MKPDLEKAINMAVSTGKVKLGYESTIKSLLTGKVKATIISSNIPLTARNTIERHCQLSNVPIIEYEKSGIDLGAICGRPHKITSVVILNPGNSKILDYI
ncbi:MAG: 50S ribosomal protein L30e [Candidatus Heimdallarchaeota archaeon]|nr:50S ribosomal protein L30e [Candidatus Heimdallarchaeota archaeon]